MAVTKNLTLQLGLVVGTETMPWNIGARAPNYAVLAGLADPLYPGMTMLKDPGAQPSVEPGANISTNSVRLPNSGTALFPRWRLIAASDLIFHF